MGNVGLIAITLVAASCSPAPSELAPPLGPVVLPVPDAALESLGITRVRWSPDGTRLIVGQSSGRLLVIGADGARLADLVADDAAWVDREILVIRTNDVGRFDGPVSLVRLDDSRLRPWPIADGATRLLAGPAGIAAIIRDDVANGWFRLLVGRMPGAEVKGRGQPVAFSGDGSRLVVVHRAAAADTATLASTGSPEPGWIEILAVPGLETVAAFPDEPIDVRIQAIVDRTGGRVAADGVRDEIVVFDVDAGTWRAVGDTCCPSGWLASGELVASGQGKVVVIDVATNLVRKVADEGWWSTVSPDDRIAASTGDHGQALLILRGDRLLARAGVAGIIESLTWRPDGRMLALTVRADDPPVRLILLPVPELP